MNNRLPANCQWPLSMSIEPFMIGRSNVPVMRRSADAFDAGVPRIDERHPRRRHLDVERDGASRARRGWPERGRGGEADAGGAGRRETEQAGVAAAARQGHAQHVNVADQPRRRQRTDEPEIHVDRRIEP